ncbi:hypothetical protein AB0M36_14715 [Actinoplanes sp. NPDC051346]|uniref:hypothetical protein n=1 Tax=Actinoplanes sp. NPDC051346 TaxID=3155048 RepID=UPI0034298689
MTAALPVEAGFFEPVYQAAQHSGVVSTIPLLLQLLDEPRPPVGPAGIAAVVGELPTGWSPLATVTLPEGPVHFARPPSGADPASPAWHLGLLWLRLGASVGRRGACVRHLADRRAGDSVILHQQLVKGQLADVLVQHLEVAAMLRALEADGPGPATRHHVHGDITAADRALLRLFGASGFVQPGPGLEEHVSELLADAYAGTGTSA